ncbi:MAG TPA: hypothetical protein VGR93_06100 [Candidatus Acidoferrales bacterium]|nr:hypothetical protein [Candidatus Acidoferrales bacterium]
MVRCPKCDAEIDLDEDEIEEGEILTCLECDAELEVAQIHPVRLNVISEDDDEEDEASEDGAELGLDEDDDEEEEHEGDETELEE